MNPLLAGGLAWGHAGGLSTDPPVQEDIHNTGQMQVLSCRRLSVRGCAHTFQHEDIIAGVAGGNTALAWDAEQCPHALQRLQLAAPDAHTIHIAPVSCPAQYDAHLHRQSHCHKYLEALLVRPRNCSVHVVTELTRVKPQLKCWQDDNCRFQGLLPWIYAP